MKVLLVYVGDKWDTGCPGICVDQSDVSCVGV